MRAAAQRWPAVVGLRGICSTVPTTLAATLPTIGSTVTLSLTGQPLAQAILVVDLATAIATALGPSGVVHADLTHLPQWNTIPLALDAGGAASFSSGVPTMPALVGQPFTAQAVVLGSASPIGLDLSNGLGGTVGY